MDCRSTLLLLGALSLAGCTTLPTLPSSPTAGAPVAAEPTLADLKPKDGPKRKPKASTMIAVAQVREDQAKSSQDVQLQVKYQDSAREMYQEAIKIDPTCVAAYLGLGRVYMRLRDHDRALETYKTATKKFPKEAQVWHDMAMCYNSRKNWDEGIRCLTKAQQVDPENRQVAQTLGMTLAMAGHIDEGLTVLSKGYGPAHAHYTVARVYRQREQIDACRKHLQLALQANATFEPAREMLAGLDNPQRRPTAPPANSAGPVTATLELGTARE